MTALPDYQRKVLLAAYEVNAAWRCQQINGAQGQLNGDLRQQLDRLSALIADFVRPMGVPR